MKSINLFQLGYGTIGKELVRQIADQHEWIRTRFSIDLCYQAVATSKELITPGDDSREPYLGWDQLKTKIQDWPNTVIIDVTAAPLSSVHLDARQSGAAVVTANKKPITDAMAVYLQLHAHISRYRYETTVGAGLPVISTLQDLLATGDEVAQIEGAFSGTLGFVCSELGKQEKSFSQIVGEAKERGYTEPHPQDDLGGLDVARKALILAREIGYELAMNDIAVEGLTPPSVASLTDVGEYMAALPTLDDTYRNKIAEWKHQGLEPRFVARIAHGRITVGLQGVAHDSALGRLQGPDNLIVFKTKRYFERPMLIQGPGAGAQVTAAGVFSDILKVSQYI